MGVTSGVTWRHIGPAACARNGSFPPIFTTPGRHIWRHIWRHIERHMRHIGPAQQGPAPVRPASAEADDFIAWFPTVGGA
jgi:hypothetical protein